MLFGWLIWQMPVNAAETLNNRYTPEHQPTIEVAHIRSNLLPGVIIGGHYEGLLRILQEHYKATGQLDDRMVEAVRYLLEEELSQAGYDVALSLSNSIFADQLPESPEPGRFLLGGTMTQVKLNAYSSWWRSYTQDERLIRWEVFDRDLGRVIYRQETEGKAQAEGVNNPAATYEAIRASFRTLLAEPSLMAALTPSAPASSGVLPVAYEIPAVASSLYPLTVEQIVGRSIPSIVQIRTSEARGSGFIIDSSGLIVTNQHVVGSAFSVKVDLYDGSTWKGRVLKRDALADVALLQLEAGATEITGLPICHTNALKVGETVVAIGNPLSLSNTVTRGIVSGFRTDASRNLIQTDAAINPGNSGGPLLNQKGAVIGIVTEKIASRGVEGLGFALPIGESLQRLHVKINAPVRSALDACGSPTLTVPGITTAGATTEVKSPLEVEPLSPVAGS